MARCKQTMWRRVAAREIVMKKWMMALVIVSLLGMSAMADAAQTVGKHKHRIHGKIQMVTGNTFTIMAGGKKHPHTMTIHGEPPYHDRNDLTASPAKLPPT